MAVPSVDKLDRLIAPVRALMVEAADSLIMPRFRSLADTDIKTKSSPTDLVTVADVETEEWLTPRLKELLPGSRVVGEEAVAADDTILDYFTSDDPIWVIDPVDGTRNFANGDEAFVSMLALVIDRQPVLGMIWRPVDRELVWAVKGQGAWSQVDRSEPLQLALRDTPIDPASLHGYISFKWIGEQNQDLVKANQEKFSKPSGLGSSGEEYVRLAKGLKHYAVFGLLNPWDHCPGIIILREAGGADSLADGSKYTTDHRRDLLVCAGSDLAGQVVHREMFASKS